jgi:chromosomal replication initiation ATPase DnaA
LDLARVPTYDRAAFIVTPANADAVRALDAWPQWHGGCLTLAGPAGAGKTHLARSWAAQVGALPWPAEGGLASAAGRPVLLEDADRGFDDEALFHLINMAPAGGGLLLTGRTPPSDWPTALPDLRSRLNALPVALMQEPDDAVLTGVMSKLFRERHIRPSDDLLIYLVRRIERSVPAARQVVARLDEAAAAEGRPVSRALAREVLEETGDLFG